MGHRGGSRDPLQEGARVEAERLDVVCARPCAAWTDAAAGSPRPRAVASFPSSPIASTQGIELGLGKCISLGLNPKKDCLCKI